LNLVESSIFYGPPKLCSRCFMTASWGVWVEQGCECLLRNRIEQPSVLSLCFLWRRTVEYLLLYILALKCPNFRLKIKMSSSSESEMSFDSDDSNINFILAARCSSRRAQFFKWQRQLIRWRAARRWSLDFQVRAGIDSLHVCVAYK